MPAVMTLGGIALAVLGLLIAFAGMPDRAAGLGLGSDLIQAGVTLLAGGLVVAALGQAVKALRDLADRVDEAGFGVSALRPSLNDTLSEAAPMPLPRAARNAPAAAAPQREPVEAPAAQPMREPRAPRGAPPVPRAARLAPEAPVAQRSSQPRAVPQAQHDYEQPLEQEFAEEFTAEPQAERPAPRWMRAQNETNNHHQPAAGTIPLQSNRPTRATPVAPANAPRREAAQAHAHADDVTPRRRAAPAPEPQEFEQGEPTVVRSGIIAGMAYTLYSDRSIEAELPAGTVRFGSIEELQEHVKRAGVDDQEEYRGPNGAPH